LKIAPFLPSRVSSVRALFLHFAPLRSNAPILTEDIALMASWKDLTPQAAQTLNVIGDCVVIAAAAAAATTTSASLVIKPTLAAGIALGALAIWAAAGRALHHYWVDNGRRVLGDIALTLLLIVALALPLVVATFVIPGAARAIDLRRFFMVHVPGVLWLRCMATWIRRRWETPPEPVLIVGVGPLGRLTGREIGAGKRHQAIGYLHFEDERRHPRLSAEILGKATDLEECLKSHFVAEVYIAGNGGSHRHEMQEAIRTCERFGIPFALPACGFRLGRARAADGASISDGYIHYLSVKNKPIQLGIKRLFDIVASSAALLVLSPLLMTVALVVKLTSRGPVLFKQERVGLHGRRFFMLKFRSMVVNAEELKAKLVAQNEMGGPVFKMKRDPRVTAIGRFIRKYSIDELPQLINVLRGEMTIVGPRPPIPSEVAKYEAWQRRRLSVRPGLTCVWQVSGRNQISFEEWMYLDMQYIDHWSLTEDFALILKTVPVVLTGRGAS
jgi:exopolysaccharide biosynthesis polyprenyl glycosylphosphotransferase